jgi:hypothetical protein
MKLIIHIGTEKTGSTSLQRWLTLNGKELVNYGVWYSSALGNQDNRLIAVYAVDTESEDDGFVQAKIYSKSDHEAFRERIKLEFSKEVEDAISHNCHTFIISSEHLHSRLTSSYMVGRVKELVSGFFDEIEVLCYLRPQAHLLQSRLSVGIRNFTFGQHEFETYFEEHYYNYDKLFNRWLEHFKNLSFFPFLRRPDVIADLSSHIGVNFSKLSSPARVNEKLDLRTGIFAYNLQIAAKELGVPVSIFRVNLNRLPVSESIQISRDLAGRIQTLYHRSNLTLTKKCSSIELSDLEVDLTSFPILGTSEKILELWDGRYMMADTMVHLNCELRIERLLSLIARSELDVIKGNLSDAQDNLRNASVKLMEVEGFVESKFPKIVQHMRAEIYRVKNELSSKQQK